MSAEITPISEKHGWGAHAAAADALQRVPNESPFVAIWIGKNADGKDCIKWSKANTNFVNLSMLAVALMEFSQSCVRQEMER